jgi:hypothetical protein
MEQHLKSIFLVSILVVRFVREEFKIRTAWHS